MRLSFEQIRELTAGAHDMKLHENGVISFFKCTDKQTQAWLTYGNETLCNRSKTTTGIRLDFHTDSKTFAFKTFSTGSFEVMIDGLLREKYYPPEGERCIEVKIDLTDSIGCEKDDIRVTLVFPSHAIGRLEYVEIDDGAYAVRHEYSTKIMFIGDSITQGASSSRDTLSFAWRLTNHYNAESFIYGIGGSFYEPETFDKVNFDPDTLIIAYGTNDATCFSYCEMQARVSKYLDLVKSEYGDKRVVVISPIWRGNAEMEPMGAEFDAKRKMIESEASLRGFEVISGLRLVPPVAECYADKYLHPTDLGFGIYAENLIKILDENKKCEVKL